MSMSWNLTIEMLSDWCVGSGYGKSGGWDRSVARDAEGLPYLPAKQLKGLWRDACERVAWGFDDGKTGEWGKLAGRLFGPGAKAGRPAEQGMLWVSDARMLASWSDYLRDHEIQPEAALIRSGLTRSRFGVAINGSTGTARDDMLREVEVARAGLQLKATGLLPDNLAWQVELLLVAGIKTIGHLGGKRRRGLGRCRVSTDRDRLDHLLKKFEKTTDEWQADDILPLPTPPAYAPQQGGAAGHVPPQWRRRAAIRLSLSQPLLAARTVLGNTVFGFDFVPGATLLPLVLSACDDAESLVREGRIVVTDATLALGALRAVPAPRGLVSANKGSEWINTGTALNSFGQQAVPAQAGVKPVGGWMAKNPRDQSWLRFEVPMVSRGHASILDDEQRTGDDGFFVYNAIDAGTTIRFEVWDDGSLDGHWHPEEITGRQCIGRSRGSGYGEVDVTVDDQPAANAPATGQLNSFVLTLESDTCILDDHGPTPTAEGLGRWLSEELGVTLEIKQSRISVRRRDSWYGAMGAPKASTVAIAAGSQIEFRVAGGSVDRAQLESLTAAGLGALSAEGYGRARFASSAGQAAQENIKATSAISPAGAGVPSPAPDEEAWRVIRRQVWIEEIYRRVADLTPESCQEIVSPAVTRSQLGSLREASRRGAGAVRRWVASTRGRKAMLRAWGEARLSLIQSWAETGGQPLCEWLKEKIPYAAPLPPDVIAENHDEVLAIVIGELTRRQSVTSAAASSLPEGHNHG